MYKHLGNSFVIGKKDMIKLCKLMHTRQLPCPESLSAVFVYAEDIRKHRAHSGTGNIPHE